MNEGYRTHRIRTDNYTITTVYNNTIGGYLVGLSFCSNLDQPNHYKGKLIATGRLHKVPIFFEPIREDVGEHHFIEGSVITYLDKFYSDYNLATKPMKIALENKHRIPRWIGNFLQEYYNKVNLKYWNDVVINKGVINE